MRDRDAIISEAIDQAREIQEYLWDELSLTKEPVNITQWMPVFRKRLLKIGAIDPKGKGAKVELKKRLLQQAALSIAALETLEEHGLDDNL